MDAGHVIILGIGSLLFSDDGFGIHVVNRLQERYEFPENVSVVDGGVLGLNLLGTISEADHLIVVDAVKNNGAPGALYRLEGEAIPERIRAKNSLHEVDFLEALTLCQVLEKIPQTVILGVEPQDVETFGLDLTPATRDRIEEMLDRVLAEMDRLGVPYRRKAS